MLEFIQFVTMNQAYGEVLWFGGKVTGLTFVSFIFMVTPFLPFFSYQTLLSILICFRSSPLLLQLGPTFQLQ